MKIFKCEAQGDTIYIKAASIDEALSRLIEYMGSGIPEELLTWTEVDKIPDGSIVL